MLYSTNSLGQSDNLPSPKITLTPTARPTGTSDREQIERSTVVSVTQRMRTATRLHFTSEARFSQPWRSLSRSLCLFPPLTLTLFCTSGKISTGETRVTNRNEKRKSLRWAPSCAAGWTQLGFESGATDLVNYTPLHVQRSAEVSVSYLVKYVPACAYA